MVRKLNADPRWNGMIVQLPLPKQIDPNVIALTIDPEKDADALHPYNVGRMLIGMPGPKSCTPTGVLELLMRTGNDPAGKNVVIIGRSNIVGKPLAALLMQKARRRQRHRDDQPHRHARTWPTTRDRPTSSSPPTGVPNALTADMIRPGAVVIDVGNNRVPDATRKSGYRMVGDVDFEAIKEVASWITPVPGGVGPMTVTMLLANTVAAAERAAGIAAAT